MECAQGGMQTCSNFEDVFSQTDKCVSSASCVELEPCLENVPSCLGGAGAPGASGAAGAAGVSACTSVCARAATCCHAITQGNDCGAFLTACATGGDTSAVTMACQGLLTAAASIPSAAAACR